MRQSVLVGMMIAGALGLAAYTNYFADPKYCPEPVVVIHPQELGKYPDAKWVVVPASMVPGRQGPPRP